MKDRMSPLGSTSVGVMQFPGSNCDADCIDALSRHLSVKVVPVWHQAHDLPKVDAILIPGGFSFGDYLRSGALASHAPIMSRVKEFAARGGAILGICNGFQILVESQLLPGVLLRNLSRRFVCKQVNLIDSKQRRLRMPIAHGEGRFWINEQGLSRLEDTGCVAYRYVDEDGESTQDANPNGSVANIAGVFSPNKKVLGLMPHPERATDTVMGGSTDGVLVLREFLEQI
jgi:phosphoribosylformylglycinamidine synthase I